MSSYRWASAIPEKHKIEQQIIDSMLTDKLESTYYSLSLLIVKNDTLITERYYKSTNSKTAFNIQSATKSFVSILTGIAINKGLIPSDIEPHILLNIIEKSSKQNILDFANENLCDKLGITIPYWLKSPNGLCMGGGPMFMTARDMARFGDLILENGEIDNQKIVDSLWIAKMTMDYVEKSLMLDENVPSKKYGYLLWLDSYRENEILLVAGTGGQLIMIVPVLNMIFVTTAKTDLPPNRLADNALNIQKLLTDYVRFEIDKMKK